MYVILIITVSTIYSLQTSTAKYYQGLDYEERYSHVFSVQETDMEASVMTFTSSARSIIECSTRCSPYEARDGVIYFEGACYKTSNGSGLVHLSVARNDDLPQVMVYNHPIPGYVGKLLNNYNSHELQFSPGLNNYNNVFSQLQLHISCIILILI